MYGKGVKVSGVRQIHKQMPGSLPLYWKKPKTTVTLQDKESAPLLQWLNSVTEDSAHMRVEGLKTKHQVRECHLQGELVSLKSSVVVVGHPG